MEQILVREVMSGSATTTNGIFVTPDTPIDEAARLMHKYKINRLPVLSDEGQILGTITASDIARARIELASPTERRESTLVQTASGMLVK